MRMSCNGCRVLRKGCSENCSIRPCLQWIKSPESQANATVFLAKFYGRAGLMNLINAGPEHLRPAIFRSLLYEACGRIVNPMYGSVGLLWSGSWQLCQAAVEAVLKGSPITPINSDAAVVGQGPPLKAYDIRHVYKDEATTEKVKTRTRVKRVMKPKGKASGSGDALTRVVQESDNNGNDNGSTSHESSLSHQSELAAVENESKEGDSMVSAETREPTVIYFRPEPESESGTKLRNRVEPDCDIGMGLQLTLGLGVGVTAEPVESREQHHVVVPMKKRKLEGRVTCEEDTCRVKLGLDYTAACIE